jgi:hypothetical protein
MELSSEQDADAVVNEREVVVPRQKEITTSSIDEKRHFPAGVAKNRSLRVQKVFTSERAPSSVPHRVSVNDKTKY